MAPVTVNAGITFSGHRANRHGPFESTVQIADLGADTLSTPVGSTSTFTAAAQSFIPAIGTVAYEVELYLSTTGSPSDNLTVELRSDSSGTPGTVLATSSAVSGSSLSGSLAWIPFSFPSVLALTASTQYWVSLSRSGGLDASNYYNWRGSTSSVNASVGASLYDGATWGAESGTVDRMTRVYGRQLYSVLIDATNNHVEVWKSTDSGATWTEADSADHKSISTTAANKVADAIQVGTSLHIAYVNASNVWQICPFDTSTDQWGTVTSGTGPAAVVNVSSTVAGFLAVRSDGDYIVLHQAATVSVMGTPYRRVNYSRYESGAWTLNTSVDAIGSNGTHADARMIAIDSADRVYFFYSDLVGTATTGGLRVKTLTSANTLNAAVTVTSSVNNANYVAGHARVIDDTTDQVVIPYVSSTGSFFLYYSNVADSPTASQNTSITATNDPETATSNPGSVALDGTTVHVFWPDASTDDLWRDSGTTAGGFGTDTEFQDAVTVQGVSVGKITDAIGIFYLDNGTVKYDSYSLGTPPLSATGSAAGTSTVAGAAKQTKELSAAANGTSTATASAKLTVKATATAAGTSTVAGNLLKVLPATATAAGTSTVTGAVKLTVEGTATATGTSTATSAAKQTKELTATSNGTSTATAALKQTKELSATAAGTSAVTGTAYKVLAATATAAGTSTVAGSAKQTKEISAVAAGTSTVTGAAKLTVESTATATGTSTVSGSAKQTKELSATAAGTSTVAGNATATSDLLATASAAGTSTVAGAVKLSEKVNGTAAGTSTAAAAAKLTVEATATAAGTSTVSGYATTGLELTATASAAGTSTATASLKLSEKMTGTAAGTSTVTAVAKLSEKLTATAAGTSTVAGNAELEEPDDGNLFGDPGFETGISNSGDIGDGGTLWESDPFFVHSGSRSLFGHNGVAYPSGFYFTTGTSLATVADAVDVSFWMFLDPWGANPVSTITARVIYTDASSTDTLLHTMLKTDPEAFEWVLHEYNVDTDNAKTIDEIQIRVVRTSGGATDWYVDDVFMEVSAPSYDATGTAAGTSTATATAKLTEKIAASAAGTSTATAAAKLTVKGTATAAGTSTITAAAKLALKLTAASDGTSTVTGYAVTGSQLTATASAAGTSSVSGSVKLSKELSAASAGTSAVTGSAKLLVDLFGSSAGTSTAAADTRLLIDLLASAAGTSTATAMLVFLTNLTMQATTEISPYLSASIAVEPYMALRMAIESTFDGDIVVDNNMSATMDVAGHATGRMEIN